ncbi:MAG: hypothetical protein GFH25_541324n8 [Chloroflexi bacterium AL-N10]|nr:hypothetical protein [Chloroflexi bacterium AL-N10]
MDQTDQLEQFTRFVREGQQRGLSRRAFLRRGLAMGLSFSTILGVLAACAAEESAPIVEAPAIATPQPTSVSTTTPTPSAIELPMPTPVSPTRFAVIGDFGLAGEPAQAVADLVKSWQPDFMITTGDNNYPDGAADSIDTNIGQYYHEFIGNYQGSYGTSSSTNRFFPVLGNHDWLFPGAATYLDYFDLPDNERYYTFTQGPIQFFALDSDPHEPDGTAVDSIQGQWFQEAIADSSAIWKVVYMHHPPFSSGLHGSSIWMQWPFHTWGVNVVLAGHDHDYERIVVDRLPYFVNGLGGGARYAPGNTAVAGSEAFYNANHGAMLIEATETAMQFQFIVRDGTVFDTYTIEKKRVGN